MEKKLISKRYQLLNSLNIEINDEHLRAICKESLSKGIFRNNLETRTSIKQNAF